MFFAVNSFYCDQTTQTIDKYIIRIDIFTVVSYKFEKTKRSGFPLLIGNKNSLRLLPKANETIYAYFSHQRNLLVASIVY
jgi:hypothetical protein